jgi:hypothetical protein
MRHLRNSKPKKKLGEFLSYDGLAPPAVDDSFEDDYGEDFMDVDQPSTSAKCKLKFLRTKLANLSSFF